MRDILLRGAFALALVLGGFVAVQATEPPGRATAAASNAERDATNRPAALSPHRALALPGRMPGQAVDRCS